MTTHKDQKSEAMAEPKAAELPLGSPHSINEPQTAEAPPPESRDAPAPERKQDSQAAVLMLVSLSPDHSPVGAGPDFLLRVTGKGFDRQCKIVFDDEELSTLFEDDTSLTAWAPAATAPGEVDVEVARGDDLSEVLTFEFIEKSGSRKGKTERKAPKGTPAHKRAKKR